MMDGQASIAVDLNADLGEIPGPDGHAIDTALLGIVTSASVAAGGHAGDPESMERACRTAISHGVRIGAHLSFDDRPGFGRRVPERIDAGLIASLARQLAILSDAADRAGTHVSYVKAHGALYNLALDHAEVAAALVDAVRDSGLPILTIHGSTLQALATAEGVVTYAEFFADRGYLPNGRLVPRGQDGDLLHDDLDDRALQAVVTGSVAAVDHTTIAVHVDSICVHGDTPDAVIIATGIRRRLLDSGVQIRAFTG